MFNARRTSGEHPTIKSIHKLSPRKISNMAKVGPQSTSTRLAKLDGRTTLAKRAKQRREELIQHVGGNPSATQKALIEQAVMLQMRIDMMDSATIEGGAMNSGDDRRYLAWANSLARLMRQLGQKSAPRPTVSLAAHIANRGG
jgi:hypothetical protein